MLSYMYGNEVSLCATLLLCSSLVFLTETHAYYEWIVNVTVLCELSHYHKQY